jgi:protein O-GlcNAc transferase
MNSASPPPTNKLRLQLETALAHQNAGRAAAAQQIYEDILRVAPDNADALHLFGTLKFQSGESEEDLALVHRATLESPERADYQNTLGVIHKSRGDFSAAKSALNAALALSPRFAEAWNNLGAVLEDEGQWADAAESYDTATMHAPQFLQALVNLGRLHFRLHRIDAAERTYKSALDLDPENAEALNGYGLALEQQGRAPDAIKAFEQATRATPFYRPAFNNLALLYLRLKRIQDAQATLDNASKHALLDARPDDSESLRAEATLRHAMGQIDEAVDAAEAATNLNPNDADNHALLGLILHDGGRLAEAELSLRHALSLDPAQDDARFNLAVVLQRQGHVDKAEIELNHCLHHAPEDSKLHRFLGVLRRTNGDLSGAAKALEKALSLTPDDVEALGNLAALRQDQGRSDDAIDLYKRAAANAPASAAAHSNLLMSLNYSADDSDALYKAHRQWAERLEAGVSPHAAKSKSHEEPVLKIGYVSGDFRRHSVAYFFEPILNHHDRRRFEIFCYASLENPDDVTARMQNKADHWRFVANLSDDQLAARIAEDQIDILVDLSGHTAHNRLAVFARKPAPVQVGWIGYPNTTGLTALQYRFTDDIADPPGAPHHADAHHSEHLVRLPHGFLCYQPPEDTLAVAPAPHLKNGYITFGSFNNLAKVTPNVITVWAEILRRSPDSRLLLKARPLADSETRDRMLAQFEAHNIDAERIILRSRTSSMADHLSQYADMDIALDTFPYNGTTTTCEALWMGVPVVSLAGARHAARVGASLLHRVGLDTCVAPDVTQYAAIAQALGGESDRLLKLRRTLRETIAASSLCDPAMITFDVENAYESMTKKECLAEIKP